LVALSAVLCSRNEHKRAELEQALPGWRLELLDAELPEERGASYEENARAKARFGRTLRPDTWLLGEDSGLEVEALGGEPGLRSARWSERPIEDLLHRLRGETERSARYRCELVCLAPDGRELRGSGTLEGRIAEEARGSEGFGYDPVFVPKGETRTVAELGTAWKARNSHRARAARSLRDRLREAGGFLGRL
jgi:XTP/dITP diphosphohydrolase